MQSPPTAVFQEFKLSLHDSKENCYYLLNSWGNEKWYALLSYCKMDGEGAFCVALRSGHLPLIELFLNKGILVIINNIMHKL